MNQDQTRPRRHRIGVDDPAAEGRTARERIQEVALSLFIEEGYDKTSLREIAERLGVTKAALYYHFPTKEDLVASLIEDRLTRIGAIIEWARERPRDDAMRRGFVLRYADLMQGDRHSKIMQFFERNQTIAKTLQAGEAMRAQMIEVMDLLSDPADPPAVQLRRSLSIFAMHASWFIMKTRHMPPEAAREASLEVALELVSGQADEGPADKTTADKTTAGETPAGEISPAPGAAPAM
jgi:AcrR family transcriptional regulator